MTLIKQTVYLPVEITEEFWKKYDSGEERPEYEIIDANNGERIDEWVNQQQGYFFTPEELNAYTQSVIKQALETAAEKANSFIDGDESVYIQGNVWSEVDKQSITNTFEETYKKYMV